MQSNKENRGINIDYINPVKIKSIKKAYKNKLRVFTHNVK